MIGLSNGANKASGSISDIGNLWVWDRMDYVPEVPGSYSQGTVINNAGIRAYSSSYNGNTVNWIYANSVSVDVDGNVRLAGTTQTVDINYTTGASTAVALRGKYAYTTEDTKIGNNIAVNKIYFFPTNCTFSQSTSIAYPKGTGYGILASKIYPINGIAGTPAQRTHNTYLANLNSSVYPTDAQSGNYWYKRLGQFGEAFDKVEVRSYIGTGTYGKDYPTILHLNDTAKFIMLITDSGRLNISSNYSNTNYPLLSYIPLIPETYTSNAFLVAPGYNGTGPTYTKCENQKIYIYNTDDSGAQNNLKDYEYKYLLIG